MKFPDNQSIQGFDDAASRSFRHLVEAMRQGDEKALHALRDELESWPQPVDRGNANIQYVQLTALREGTKYLNTEGNLRSSEELDGYKASASGERNGYRFFFLLYEDKVLVVAIAAYEVLLLMEKPEAVGAVVAAAAARARIGAAGKGN